MSVDQGTIFVKTCGLRSLDVAEAAVNVGADAIGFMLAPSKRQVSIGEAIAIYKELVANGARVPEVVAVTVNASNEEIDAIANSGIFSTIQLSGDEEPEILARIPASLAVWKALRPAPGVSTEAVVRSVSAWLDGSATADRVMLDAFHPGAYGGSGVLGNWSVAAAIARHYPIILAGGLHPDNVADAIAQVAPFGVDVSSGIESDGVKDPAKIAAFVRAARSARISTS